MKVVGLFAGIGGIERGFEKAGHESTLLVENDAAAAAVLRARFSDVALHDDVTTLSSLPAGTDLVTAGFPCQDLSQAGRTNGIEGKRSGLVSHVFRLLGEASVPWVMIENVPFMLQLDRGAAMDYVVAELERLGYRWAYRIVDTRAFGLPQRRRRVYLLASRDEAPEELLFAQDAGEPAPVDFAGRACGFYWTEGNRGLGWAVDAVPTLKGGSGLGIPSPPGIWLPDGRIVTPDVRDTERLQGFPADWTLPAVGATRASARWKLVGNAVSVPVPRWVGGLLANGSTFSPPPCKPLTSGSWPNAAFGSLSGRFVVDVSEWPSRTPSEPLSDFLTYLPNLLSERASKGFLSRLTRSSLRYPAEFEAALEEHLAVQYQVAS